MLNKPYISCAFETMVSNPLHPKHIMREIIFKKKKKKKIK